MGFHQFSLALVVMIMIIPLKPDCGRAAVLVKSNTTYQCNGLLNGCRIGEDLESELEFFMGSTNVIRFLQDPTPHPVQNALNPNDPVTVGKPGCNDIYKCAREAQ